MFSITKTSFTTGSRPYVATEYKFKLLGFTVFTFAHNQADARKAN